MSNVQRRPGILSNLQDMERRIKTLETAARLRSSSVTDGSLEVQQPGDFILLNEEGDVIWRASEDTIKTQGIYDEEANISIPDNWTSVGSATVAVPIGFSSAHFLQVVSCGDTFTTQGNVSVLPRVEFIYLDGTNDGFNGPAVNSGNSNVSVATSFWSRNFVTNAYGDENPLVMVRYRAQVTRSGTELAGNGNWHIAVSTIFKRGSLS